MASATESAVTRVSSSWRELGRMRGFQVPMALGSALAALAGVVMYALAILREAALVVPATSTIFLVVLGALGFIGYVVSKENVRNGALVAGIAGLGLVLLGGGIGLFTGLIVLVGAIWGLARA
jgi:VIT1/CCC1 family predicted Fe2+/Mn2+ transporter